MDPREITEAIKLATGWMSYAKREKYLKWDMFAQNNAANSEGI